MDLGLPHIFLKPGELFMTKEPAVVSTVLGSCISATFYDSKTQFAAICHALLPNGPLDNGFKYVDSTLLYIVDAIRKQGITMSMCEVKLFGGADVLLPRSDQSNSLSIGQKNIAMAHELFGQHGIEIKSADIGGILGRKLFFNTHTGDVFVKKVRKSI